MTDTPPQNRTVEQVPLPTTGDVDFRLIELFFFAYREFTADADELLSRYGFGRAHHRILHFVNRNPGMTIAELLELLQITKQSLSRVLRQLIEDGFIVLMPGDDDRRQRLLYPTPKGRELTLELSRIQARRIDAAMAATGPEHSDSIRLFLLEMGKDRAATRDWYARKDIAQKERT
ncbi:MarR family winged helix-turn-helix transcriptional regulator [Aureimonas fodinaquatilis]|uniref:MarR family winged helix-turn-helix transcriptional regulator n=1 Tax=Aureimonas fodinaquatilis TaxID=2565783 RepID=UPI003CCC5302